MIAMSNGTQRHSKRLMMLHSCGALLDPGVHQADFAVEAEPLSGQYLNLHVVWQHRQLLQTKPLHCTGKSGRVMGASSCTAAWWHYICLSWKVQMGVTSLWESGSKISVLSVAVMLFKMLPSKDVVLEKKKTSYFFIVFLTGTVAFYLLIYIAYDKGI